MLLFVSQFMERNLSSLNVNQVNVNVKALS